MFNMFANDAQQQALGFLVAQTSYIEPTVYRMKYPELNYRDLVPIDASASEWAKSVTFYSVDMVGRADWFNHLARDIPLADITRGKHEIGIEMAAVGYRYTLEELGQAMMVPNTNLTVERAAAAKRAYEEFVHNKALYGAVEKNWLGLLNHSAPTVINAGQTWAYQLAQSPVGTTPILNDVNGVLTNIWQASMTVETADTLLMPLKSMAQLAITQLPNTTMNLMEWLKKNNMYTQTTGGELKLVGVRGLDTGGAAGQARAVAYRKDPEIVKMHIPMPHRFLPVWQTGPMVFDIPGVFRLAGLEIRRPGAFRYLDGNLKRGEPMPEQQDREINIIRSGTLNPQYHSPMRPEPTKERLDAKHTRVTVQNTSPNQNHIVIDRYNVGHELRPGERREMEMLDAEIANFQEHRRPGRYFPEIDPEHPEGRMKPPHPIVIEGVPNLADAPLEEPDMRQRRKG